MLYTAIVLVAALLALPLLAYWLAPAWLLGQLVAMTRRRGGLVRKVATVNGAPCPYLDGGKPGGVPLVMVHGFGGDKDNWAFYASFLTGHYRLICPDLPGFGESQRAPDGDYSVEALARWLVQFLDALGVERCHLGGNSMGGYIALHFALDHPQRLASLTLVNNAGVMGAEASELQQMVLAQPGVSPLVPRSVADVRRLMAFVAYRPRFIPAGFLKVMLGIFAAHADLLDAIFLRLLDSMLNSPLNHRLGEVKVPTQIIWGRHDRLIDVSCAEAEHAGIAGSELVVFEDAGHVPMIELPGRTAHAQLEFLARH